ncbi:MAG: HNH endonuclease [Gemmataceae bacterium]
MRVADIVTRGQAIRLLRDDNLYDATEWIVDPSGSGSALKLGRCLAAEVTNQLMFASPSGPRPPCFRSEGVLDNQATRGVRRITPATAALLDKIISATDGLTEDGSLLTVTDRLIRTIASQRDFQSPDEVPTDLVYREGAVSRVLVNRYERDPDARLACIAHHGATCSVCGFDFSAVYGPLAQGYIHVHHLKALSDCQGNYDVNPVSDLRPICPNCHAVVHLGGANRELAEVRGLMQASRSGLLESATRITDACDVAVP